MLGRYDRAMRARQPVGGPPFSPNYVFRTGAQGVWYDPSDFSTLFQDAAGTTPVTAVEQPVGRMLDKSGRGNHATQTTLTSRPILRARYNLLTQSENFADAAWGKLNYQSLGLVSHPNPFGASNSWLAIPNTTMSAKTIDRTDVHPAAQRKGIFAKAAGYRFIQINWGAAFSMAYANFDLQTGTVTATSGCTATAVGFGDGWFFCTAEVVGVAIQTAHGYTVIASGTAGRGEAMTGDGTSGAYLWGADLRASNDALGMPPYQRVNTPTDYDTAGFLPYLFCDGIDDGMVTANIDFTGTNKVTVCAGVRKLSDAARAMVVEFGDASVTTVGLFFLEAPFSSTDKYRFASIGQTLASLSSTTNSKYTAPTANVLTGVGNISGDRSTLRVNGAQVAQSTADQGTGNYSNRPLYLFRRGGTSLPFNGRCYGLTIVGTLLNDSQLQQLERWMNRKTGAY